MEDCKDQKLISRIENVLSDDSPTGKNNNFDLCVQHLLPACPVYARRKKDGMSNNNEGGKNISVSSLHLKRGKGSTGVDLRWHSKGEYKKISEPQKDELHEWKRSDAGKKATEEYKKTCDAKHKVNPSGDNAGKPNDKKLRKTVAAAIKKEKTHTADNDSKLSGLAAKLVSSMSKTNVTVGTKVGSAKVTFDDEINAKVAAVLNESNIQFKFK